MKKSFILLFALCLLFVSCATKPVYITHYMVGNTEYLVQNEGEFMDPGKPYGYFNEKRQEFLGWSYENSMITDWTTQPVGEIYVQAVIKDINFIDLYVNQKPYLAISEKTLALSPKAPDNPTYESLKACGFKSDELDEDFSEGYSFKDNTLIGWAIDGTNELFEDWDKPLTKSIKLNAVYKPIVLYYVNNELWKEQYVSDFADPGAPAATDLLNGYEFEGWVNMDETGPYADWSVKPEVLRFDALLSLTTADDSALLNSERISLDRSSRSYDILGPLTVSETYQIVNGKIKTNKVGYKDILAEARRLYPSTDQVIDIVVDYETKEIDTDYSLLMTDAESTSAKRFVFRTASYTGLAIDLH
ncbi:MAG: hypothetical protein ACI4NM_04845 [Bullifex sp.]